MDHIRIAPILRQNASDCERCGNAFRPKKKNCHNCGYQVCVDCSNYKTKLPHFGYNKPVRCCGYCAIFLHVYSMDDKALSGLNIKTLKRYLTSYNISTHGMIEKQELIKAIKDNRPLPEASEVYFRQHMPDTVDKSTFFQEEFSSFSKSFSSENRFWDMDKFFSKLFGHEDTQPVKPKPNSHSNPPPPTPPRPNSQHRTQSESQHQSMPFSQSTGPTFQHMPTPQPFSGTSSYPQMPIPPPNWSFRPKPDPTYTPSTPSPQHPFTTHPPGPSSFNGGYSQQYPPQSSQFNTAHSQHYPGYPYSSPPHQGYQHSFQHNHQQYSQFQNSQQYQYRPEQQNYQQSYPQYQHQHHQHYQQPPPTSSFPGTTGSNFSSPNHHHPSGSYTPGGMTQADSDAHTPHSWIPPPNPPQPHPTETSKSEPSQTEGQSRPPPQSRPDSYSTFNSDSQTSAGSPPPSRRPRAPQDRHDYLSTNHSTSAPESMQRSEPEPRPRTTSRAPQTSHSTTLLTLKEVISENVDPSTLSIKVIKSLLDTNCVSYIGVVEKSDLVSCLQKLMNSAKAEQDRIAKEQETTSKNHQGASASSSSTSQGGVGVSSEDDNLCKVCYEASLSCVMLNCNHMVTCMDCGKAIMESTRICPICREYVVKLLHVFKA